MFNVYKYIYGFTPFELESKLNIDEIAKALSTNSDLNRHLANKLKGHIDGVNLYLLINSSFFNINKPVFIGKFEKENFLKGKITMHWLGKVIFTFWTILILSFCLIIVVSGLPSPGNFGSPTFVVLGITALILLMSGNLLSVAWGKWLARGDFESLPDLIKELCQSGK